MTLWTFDFRSNDSDIEDDETDFQPPTISRPQQPTRQTKIDNELEELFGTMEESVEYKPDPWSIAKINAHSRNTAPVIKSKPNATWKPTSNSSLQSTGLVRFWKHPKSIVKDGRVLSSDMSPNAGTHQSPNAGKSLRDSISDALRRGGPVATTQDQDTPARARIHEVRRSADQLEPQLTDTTPSPNTHQPLGTSIRPPRAPQPMSQVFALEKFSAYTPDGYHRMPVFDKSPREAEDIQRQYSYELSSDNTYPFEKLATPAPGFGDQHSLNDSLCLSPCPVDDQRFFGDGSMHMPIDLRAGLQWDNHLECAPNRFRAASPECGQRRIFQSQAHLAPPYSDSPITKKLESSPTVQLIAKFAAPKPDKPMAASKRPEHSDPGAHCAESPVFAWSPPSPTPQHIQASRQIHITHTPKRASHATQNLLHTPPRKKATHQFDLDAKPFWSTLPTPPNSTLKPPTDGMKSSQFLLPGAFLTRESSGRTLYKPPPRKRTRSRGDEEPGTRWKVTRVG
ncbi:unnamed protein product [Rhizoctonia solani]|uniref:Uncharacterized protein n=1 Tax=Rhizoctonia solani TaxID=456999 RepID=A0A8H3D2A3_9AGAM|nr:unnamed protein product [Rhizoctonia solani]CAE6507254.1 unnamed protein product [Rhizoctonia solani]